MDRKWPSDYNLQIMNRPDPRQYPISGGAMVYYRVPVACSLELVLLLNVGYSFGIPIKVVTVYDTHVT